MGWEEIVWEEGRGFHGEVNRLTFAGGKKWACFEKKKKRVKFPFMLFEPDFSHFGTAVKM